MNSLLSGVRVACFYPWPSFSPTGAWSRFSCLWKYLLEQGAEVTLAFLEVGNDTELKGISIRYLGSDTDLKAVSIQYLEGSRTFKDEWTRNINSRSNQGLQAFSQSVLDFLIRYEKGFYLSHPKTSAWLERIIADSDIVTCEYPFYAPLLSEFCKNKGKSLIVTAHDVLYERRGICSDEYEALKQNELRALRMADELIFVNEHDRHVFATYGLKGTTVLNTGDVISVTPGNEEHSRQNTCSLLNISTSKYCLFVGSSHGPNFDAVTEVKLIAKMMPEMTFVVLGSCCEKMQYDNFIATGPVTDISLDSIYRGAFAVIIPLSHGTGTSVKFFQAFIYEKAVVSTSVGSRGYSVTDGKELLLVDSISDFPAAIRRLLAEKGLRESLAGHARAYALGLDYRIHFQPYADIIARRLKRTIYTQSVTNRRLILVDNNLSSRVGHHYNYALALKKHCDPQGHLFSALIGQHASADVLADLSAKATFSVGLHEEFKPNPFPPEWGDIRPFYDFLHSNDLFANELEAGLHRTARPGDLVFIPNATPRQILGLALLLLKNPIYRRLEYVILLRYSTYISYGPIGERKIMRDNQSSNLYALSIAKLTNTDHGEGVRFATDSDELAKEYATFTKRPIEILPIPHTNHATFGITALDYPIKSLSKIRIIYLGDARDEKGFHFLLAILAASVGNPLLFNAEFVFQAHVSGDYHKNMFQVIDAIENLKLSNVHLIRRALSSEEYKVLLESADLVLLPYDSLTYRARASGPFIESICANKPVVIPRDSWMSAQLGESQAGVTFQSGQFQDLIRAVLSAVSNLTRHKLAAHELGRKFREYHNPINFIRKIMRTS